MGNLLSTIRTRSRADRSISFDDYLEFFRYNNLEYPTFIQTLGGGHQQQLVPTFSGLGRGAYARNGIVFACIVAHMQLFSEIRFKFQPKRSYAPGDLYGTGALTLLEQPEPRKTTRQMLMQMSLDSQLAGNWYARKEQGVLRRMNPEWVTLVLGTPDPDGHVGDIDTEIVGYLYRPFGIGDPVTLLPDEVAHYAPVPDPNFPWRGMSWLQPVIEDIMGDNATTAHKLKFFENGATANTAVTLNISKPDEFQRWIELFDEDHKGVRNAYRTLFLGAGADVKVIGADMKQLDFKVTQAHGEVRVCNAARIPPIIVGVSEGLDSATYSNYGQARRAWADGSMRPDWGLACDILGPMIDVPPDSRLWYDDRQVAFLQEDQQDLAETQATQANAIASLINAGFKPATVVAAIQSGDLTQLQHTGLFSIQLQPPGTTFPGAGGGNANTASAERPQIACSLCHERASSNADCPRCAELHDALCADHVATVRQVAQQLGIGGDEAAAALLVSEPRKPSRVEELLAMNGHGPDWLIRERVKRAPSQMSA